jgi:hypothetical protein
MPDVLHSTLSTTELHEPKGIAAATSGDSLIADGSGSGTWQPHKTGWSSYKDGSTGAQTFTATAAKLQCDGVASTIETYAPLEIRGSGSLWNVTTDDIIPIALGDSYSVRVDLPVTARTSANYITLTLDIGSTAGITNAIVIRRIETDRAAPFDVSVNFTIFCLDTFIANGGQFFIATDTGTIAVTAPGIVISRTHGEYS